MSKAPELPHEVAPKVRDACLCLNVQRAARALARRYDDALRLEIDRRSRRLRLTPEGRAVLASALPVWEGVQKRYGEQLGVDGIARLLRDLRALA